MVLNWHNDRSGGMYTSKSLEGEPRPQKPRSARRQPPCFFETASAF